MKKYEIINGAEMIARAAIDAGINFFAGYPITPASSIFTAMIAKLQARGKIAIGTSDEISALAMCIGASMRGAKSMTATAAPGLSLMVESIGYAFATETPTLIVLGQRLGPSTGAATQSAQGDISFVENLISGGYTIPVIAISSIYNAYRETIHAINTAERLRCPVILLTEKDIIMSNTNIDHDQFCEDKAKLEVFNREAFKGDEVFKTYNFNQLSEIPEFLATGIGGDDRVVATASLHDKAGNLVKSSPEAFLVLEHLREKIENNIDLFDLHDYQAHNNQHGNEITVITFLATSLSAKAAVLRAQAKGIKVNHLTLSTLFPVPIQTITKYTQDSDVIIIPEINHQGQYANIIQKHLVGKRIVKINSPADLIDPELIYKEIVANAS